MLVTIIANHRANAKQKSLNLFDSKFWINVGKIKIETSMFVGRIRVIIAKIIAATTQKIHIDSICRKERNKKIEMNIYEAECENCESKVE